MSQAVTPNAHPPMPPSANADMLVAPIHDAADMDVDPVDSLLIEHEHMTEKTDMDFFNGARGVHAHVLPVLTRDVREPPLQTFRTTSTTTTLSDRACEVEHWSSMCTGAKKLGRKLKLIANQLTRVSPGRSLRAHG